VISKSLMVSLQQELDASSLPGLSFPMYPPHRVEQPDTGWMFVYTMQPVVQPVVQPVGQPVLSSKQVFAYNTDFVFLRNKNETYGLR